MAKRARNIYEVVTFKEVEGILQTKLKKQDATVPLTYHDYLSLFDKIRTLATTKKLGVISELYYLCCTDEEIDDNIDIDDDRARSDKNSRKILNSTESTILGGSLSNRSNSSSNNESNSKDAKGRGNERHQQLQEGKDSNEIKINPYEQAVKDAELAVLLGSSASLPHGWLKCIHPFDGSYYYYSTITTETCWSIPEEIRYFIPDDIMTALLTATPPKRRNNKNKKIAALTISEIKKLEKEFDVLDLDGNGYISATELAFAYIYMSGKNNDINVVNALSLIREAMKRTVEVRVQESCFRMVVKSPQTSR